MEHPWADPKVIQHSRLLTESFKKWTNKDLLEGEWTDGAENSFMLYHASFVVVSHGMQQDPIFNYANVEAQKLWQISWNEFTSLPSKFSVEPIEVSERQKLLDEAQEKGFVDNYEGIRIKKNGEKFRIKDTILWNIVDARGAYLGQAAMFKNWSPL